MALTSEGTAVTHYVVLAFFGANCIRTTVTASPQIVSSWIHGIPRSCNSGSPGVPQIVGFTVESQLKRHPIDDRPVALLQLCVGDSCLIFQLLHCDAVFAPDLRSFLGDPRFCFVGVDVEEHARRLWRDHGLEVRNTMDLRDAAMKLLRLNLHGAGLKQLVKEVMGVEMERPEALRISTWQQRVLSTQQIAHAAVEAFASFELGRIMLD